MRGCTTRSTPSCFRRHLRLRLPQGVQRRLFPQCRLRRRNFSHTSDVASAHDSSSLKYVFTTLHHFSDRQARTATENVLLTFPRHSDPVLAGTFFGWIALAQDAAQVGSKRAVLTSGVGSNGKRCSRRTATDRRTACSVFAPVMVAFSRGSRCICHWGSMLIPAARSVRPSGRKS